MGNDLRISFNTHIFTTPDDIQASIMAASKEQVWPTVRLESFVIPMGNVSWAAHETLLILEIMLTKLSKMAPEEERTLEGIFNEVKRNRDNGVQKRDLSAVEDKPLRDRDATRSLRRRGTAQPSTKEDTAGACIFVDLFYLKSFWIRIPDGAAYNDPKRHCGSGVLDNLRHHSPSL